MNAFKVAMRKVRKRIIAQNGKENYEYHGGVERQKDIDIFGVYRVVKDTIPQVEVIIRKVLGKSAATAANERSFNH